MTTLKMIEQDLDYLLEEWHGYRHNEKIIYTSRETRKQIAGGKPKTKKE